MLAINGGGFEDPGGAGKGAMPIGNVVANGELLWGGYSSTVGMDGSGQLHVGEFYGGQCVEMGLQWALAYGPTPVENGEIRPGLDALYVEPRTAVGQRADGAVIFVVLQGRQPAVLGVSRQQLAEIMVEYGAVNAGNLDGGASSDMCISTVSMVNVCNTSGGPRGHPHGSRRCRRSKEDGKAKRPTLLLICLLVFVALVGGAAAWMYFPLGGALAPVTAEDAVQELLDTTDTAEWRAKYVSLCAPETSVLKCRDRRRRPSSKPYRGEKFRSG